MGRHNRHFVSRYCVVETGHVFNYGHGSTGSSQLFTLETVSYCTVPYQYRIVSYLFAPCW